MYALLKWCKQGSCSFATLQHWCWHIIMLSCHSAERCFSFYWHEQQISYVPREIIEGYEGPVWHSTGHSLLCPLVLECLIQELVPKKWKMRGIVVELSLFQCTKGMVSRIGKMNVCSIFRCVTLMTFSTKQYRLMILFFQIPACWYHMWVILRVGVICPTWVFFWTVMRVMPIHDWSDEELPHQWASYIVWGFLSVTDLPLWEHLWTLLAC
jgi:hypothetical protein